VLGDSVLEQIGLVLAGVAIGLLLSGAVWALTWEGRRW